MIECDDLTNENCNYTGWGGYFRVNSSGCKIVLNTTEDVVKGTDDYRKCAAILCDTINNTELGANGTKCEGLSVRDDGYIYLRDNNTEYKNAEYDGCFAPDFNFNKM